LLDHDQLSKNDKEYINAYHKKVWDTISPHLTDNTEATEWLKNATAPL
jgi:Xaa-Pro aminopeptidase